MTVIEHARTYWKAVLLATALCIASGQLLPLWASLPINVAMGWTLGHWPHGVRLGPLGLMRQVFKGISPLVIALAEWRWYSGRLDHAAWRLVWLKSTRFYWFLPEYRSERRAHLLSWSLELPYLGTLALDVHTAIPGAESDLPKA